jgi:hypothetical protein
MLASPRVKQAFDLSLEPDRLRDDYGRTTYGQSCLLARRLVEAGVRFVSAYFAASIGGENGGWDNHGDNFNVLGSGYRPVHRGARQPEAASAHRGRPADHGIFLVIHAG